MKKIYFFLITGVVTLLGAASLGFINGPNVKNSAEANYQEYCAGCHGEQLQSFVNRQWMYGNSWNEVYKAIKVGYPNDGMPSYDTTFTDTEIGELVDYILGGIEQVTIQSFDEKPNLSGVIASEDLNFRLDTLATDLEIPWGLAFLPNGDILVTERTGGFNRLTSAGEVIPIAGAPKVKARGQGGLLDVEVHPNFEENGWIYLSYSKPVNSDATTAIMRAKLDGNRLVDAKDIFVAEPALPTRHHYGSRMEFDADGYLFFTVGDRGRRDDNPQSLDNHCGKVHRMMDDGSVPKDNPFVGNKNAKGTIYSYGHRNPQGLTIDPETGTIWENEHGPRGGDEINIIRKGENFGWPVISYGINYNGTKFTDMTEKEGMLQPEYYWLPSIGVCGMAIVRSDKYPGWNGDLLSGSLRFKYLHRTKIEDGKVVGQEVLLKNIGRLRDVKVGPDGFIYVTVEENGMVIRLVPEEA